MTLNGAIMQLVELSEHPRMPVIFRPAIQKVVETISELEEKPEPQWIPCSERMPETEEKVLCCTVTKKGIKNIVIGYYMADMKYWACGMNSNVIAWMPLPEVYGGEADG